MKQTFFILLSTVFVNNVVLTQFLGLCPLLGTSRKIETALGMGLATTFVLTLAALCSYGVNHYLLIPFGLDYLRTISFIVVIACVVQLTELLIHKISPLLYQVLGLYLPLITSNCAVLGVALLNAQTQNNLLQSGLYGFGTAVGFTLVLLLFAGLRERLEGAAVPQPFQGNAIALITAGLMSLAFMGFAGMARV